MVSREVGGSTIGYSPVGTTVAGTGAFLNTFSVTLPKANVPLRPRFVMITISISSSEMNLHISSAESQAIPRLSRRVQGV